MGKYSKAQLRATKKYEAKAYDKWMVRFKKGQIDLVRDYAKSSGESINSVIVNSVINRIGCVPLETVDHLKSN